jgi:hypothetical protein
MTRREAIKRRRAAVRRAHWADVNQFLQDIAARKAWLERPEVQAQIQAMPKTTFDPVKMRRDFLRLFDYTCPSETPPNPTSN